MKKLIILMMFCAGCAVTKNHPVQYRVTPVYINGKTGQPLIIKN